MLLFNQAAVQACGPICQDIYGVYPNTPQSQYPAAAHKVAEWLLTQVALRGNGVYQEFLDGNIQSLGLGALDYSSLASRNVLKSLIVQSLRSEPAVTLRKVDSDGDGLPDDADQAYLYAGSQFSPFQPDSNQDGFSDRFEVLHQAEGFHPGSPNKDLRGCDPTRTATLGCRYFTDTDGDGLTQWEEAYLGTHPNLVDSDGDGIPDGIEVRYGLDPLTSNNGKDTDSDGISDLEEIRAGTDPSTPDRSLYDSSAVQYTFVANAAAETTASATITPSAGSNWSRRRTTSERRRDSTCSRCGLPKRRRVPWPATTASGRSPVPGRSTRRRSGMRPASVCPQARTCKSTTRISTRLRCSSFRAITSAPIAWELLRRDATKPSLPGRAGRDVRRAGRSLHRQLPVRRARPGTSFPWTGRSSSTAGSAPTAPTTSSPPSRFSSSSTRRSRCASPTRMEHGRSPRCSCSILFPRTQRFTSPSCCSPAAPRRF